jgi:hypothetical protein
MAIIDLYGDEKLMVIHTGATGVSLYSNIYHDWKQWSLDNLQYLPAFNVIGGETISYGTAIGRTFFLINGWKIRTWEGDHRLTVYGNLFTSDGSSPFVPTLGNYNVTIEMASTNIINEVSTNVDGVAAAVRSNLTPELTMIDNIPTASEMATLIQTNAAGVTAEQNTMLLEMYKLMGLDPTVPLVVSQTARVAADIRQTINIDGYTKTTVVQRI